MNRQRIACGGGLSGERGACASPQFSEEEEIEKKRAIDLAVTWSVKFLKEQHLTSLIRQKGTVGALVSSAKNHACLVLTKPQHMVCLLSD